MKLQKAFKDNCTNTNYKRPFILDKIERDIHHRNIRNIRNFINFKNQDFLIKKRKELKKIKLPYKIKSTKNAKEEFNLNNRRSFISLIPMNNIKKNVSQRKINKKLNRQRSDFDLPMIVNRNMKNQSLYQEKQEKTTMTFFNDNDTNTNSNTNNNNINVDNKMTNNGEEEKKKMGFKYVSDMMSAKDLYHNKSRKKSIISFLNIIPGDKSLNENYKIINNASEINDRYNLHLKLLKKNNSNSKIFKGKKYNIFGMLNQLFHYYSSESKNINNRNNKNISSINYKNSTSDFDTIENKKNNIENMESGFNTVDVIKDTYEDDSNTFLTKLQNYNYNISTSDKKDNPLNISQLIKKRCSLSEIKKNNDEIIDNDKKIGIDCLLSKVQRKISIKKILYKYIDKTLYELEDDPTYLRIKEFEEKLIKILKNKY
jgi:hypothetical protein